MKIAKFAYCFPEKRWALREWVIEIDKTSISLALCQSSWKSSKTFWIVVHDYETKHPVLHHWATSRVRRLRLIKPLQKIIHQKMWVDIYNLLTHKSHQEYEFRFTFQTMSFKKQKIWNDKRVFLWTLYFNTRVNQEINLENWKTRTVAVWNLETNNHSNPRNKVTKQMVHEQNITKILMNSITRLKISWCSRTITNRVLISRKLTIIRIQEACVPWFKTAITWKLTDAIFDMCEGERRTSERDLSVKKQFYMNHYLTYKR